MTSTQHIELANNYKVYFAGDFHLGIPNAATSLEREKLICEWLQVAAKDAAHIILMGDVFDVWMEYKTAVPKGYVRLLGCLATLRDAGIPISLFTGNHDLWMYGYFEQELQIKVYHQPQIFNIAGKQFFVAHGDGLGPGDNTYKFLKKFLRNPICQWAYRWIHPDIGIRIADYFSKKGVQKKAAGEPLLSDDKEYLIQFCNQHAATNNIDYYLFGHRHLMIEKNILNKSVYINTGDWLQYNSYAVFDGKVCKLIQWKK